MWHRIRISIRWWMGRTRRSTPLKMRNTRSTISSCLYLRTTSSAVSDSACSRVHTAYKPSRAASEAILSSHRAQARVASAIAMSKCVATFHLASATPTFRLIVPGTCALPASARTDRRDAVGRKPRQLAEGFLDDPAAFADGLPHQHRRRRVAIGINVDIHAQRICIQIHYRTIFRDIELASNRFMTNNTYGISNYHLGCRSAGTPTSFTFPFAPFFTVFLNGRQTTSLFVSRQPSAIPHPSRPFYLPAALPASTAKGLVL